MLILDKGVDHMNKRRGLSLAGFILGIVCTLCGLGAVVLSAIGMGRWDEY